MAVSGNMLKIICNDPVFNNGRYLSLFTEVTYFFSIYQASGQTTQIHFRQTGDKTRVQNLEQCREMNSKYYLEYEEPIRARQKYYPCVSWSVWHWRPIDYSMSTNTIFDFKLLEKY